MPSLDRRLTLNVKPGNAGGRPCGLAGKRPCRNGSQGSGNLYLRAFPNRHLPRSAIGSESSIKSLAKLSTFQPTVTSSQTVNNGRPTAMGLKRSFLIRNRTTTDRAEMNFSTRPLVHDDVIEPCRELGVFRSPWNRFHLGPSARTLHTARRAARCRDDFGPHASGHGLGADLSRAHGSLRGTAARARHSAAYLAPENLVH